MNTKIKYHSIDSEGFKLAWKQLDKILATLTAGTASKENDKLFISTSLEFARICFALGKGFNRLTNYLKDADTASIRIGDQRSHAMINLHLGRLYYFSEHLDKAVETLAMGKAEVELLGDEDISAQAAEFIGLFYFIQGYFIDAKKYFEQATKSFEFGEYGYSGPLWLGYCYCFLGHYNRAIGTLDYYRRIANEKGNRTLATTLRSVLGLILVSIKKLKEAGYHLSGALQSGLSEKNDIATYFAKGGIACHHFMEGRIEESKESFGTAIAYGSKFGLVRQYASPFALEIIFEYHHRGMTPVPDFEFLSEAEKVLKEPNIHLRGVVLRLLAIDGLQKGEDQGIIRSKLIQSQNYLKLSGDPLQLAKTQIEMARLSLKHGNKGQALYLAQKAWKGFSGYEDTFYPDDLRHLLIVNEKVNLKSQNHESMFHRFTEMIEVLVSSDNLNDLLTQTVKATNRLFGAERGGVFWFGSRNVKKQPKLIAAHNLSQNDTSKEVFRPSINLIFKAFHENKPQIQHYNASGINPDKIRAMLAIPFEVEGKIKGILYHDNSYINDCFNHFNKKELMGMASSLSKYINHILLITRKIEKKASANFKQLEGENKKTIISASSSMKKILRQTDKIAQTSSTVLILGETGVGKELLAQRIHDLSHQKDYSLIVVNPTSIPETLVESELFGHEKGAFTGADKQRTGRIELAHRGTLFIDEIGEIPLSIQVKLLRTIQEKSLVRVGGTTTIKSDFRLITATNRDLKKEVAQGRFREDLFYRLNVIPIKLPPLRNRDNDIILLSEYFLKKYGEKYNHKDIKLKQADKDMLLNYEWPGNVRELENIIERAVLLSDDDRLEFQLEARPGTSSPEEVFTDRPSMDEMQRKYINLVLEESNGKVGGKNGAAQKLGMKRTSLHSRMKKLGIQ